LHLVVPQQKWQFSFFLLFSEAVCFSYPVHLILPKQMEVEFFLLFFAEVLFAEWFFLQKETGGVLVISKKKGFG